MREETGEIQSRSVNLGNGELEENEPYLGPAWAVAMLILYFLKEAFPAEDYTAFWWFQIYVVSLVIAVTVFTLIKRRQFYQAEKLRAKKRREAALVSYPEKG